MRAVALAVLIATASVAKAQSGPGTPPPERARVEQQLRARLGEVVKQRLGLNTQQMQQLNAANRKFDGDRLALLNSERRVRMAIRQQIEAGDKAAQDRISALMDSTLLIERRRLDLMEGEQNELKKFLTPRQRAQYFGLQSQLRQRMQQMRQNRALRARRGPPQ